MHKTSKLSLSINLDDVRKEDEVLLDLRATADECAALAKRFKIPEVKDLNAHVRITKGLSRDLFDVEGDIIAHVVQECCVTLAPVNETVEDSFSEMLTTSPRALEAEEGESDDKPVEFVEYDTIDVGEIVAQWLGLSLDPFPRVTDSAPFTHIEAELDNPTHKPFEVLETLKGK